MLKMNKSMFALYFFYSTGQHPNLILTQNKGLIIFKISEAKI